MRITKESECEATDAVQTADGPPKLTVVENPKSEGVRDEEPGEKDWDPYVVWKNLIRHNPDRV